jgi:HAD superfamily hydrolase (TIGR01509 family)
MPSGPEALCRGAGAGYDHRVRAGFALVIFDNDGVLVDSEPHAQRVEAALLTELGWPITPQACFARFLGRSIAAIRALVEAELGRPLPDDFERRFHARLFEAFQGTLRPVPGVVEALARIVMPTCVASSGTHERIRVSLTAAGLFGRFAGRIFSADDVARGKPAPDLFLHAARAPGVDPADCAVIEDSEAGVAAANAAGMTAFGFAAVTPAARLRAASGGVFSSMTELPARLARRRRVRRRVTDPGRQRTPLASPRATSTSIAATTRRTPPIVTVRRNRLPSEVPAKAASTARPSRG